jgi:hypothetical protein
MPENWGTQKFTISSGGMEYEMASSHGLPNALGDQGTYSRTGRYWTAPMAKPRSTAAAAVPSRRTARFRGITPDPVSAKTRNRPIAPQTRSMYCSSCGWGLSTASPTVRASAPQAQYRPSRTPRTTRNRAIGSKAEMNSLPS